MKMTDMLAATALVFLLTVVAGAQGKQASLTGKWQGETPGGSKVELDLKVKDTALTGTLTRNGQPTPITDGKVAKNTFTFKAKLDDQIESLTGELDGDQITVWLDRQDRSRAAILKRVKAAK